MTTYLPSQSYGIENTLAMRSYDTVGERGPWTPPIWRATKGLQEMAGALQ